MAALRGEVASHQEKLALNEQTLLQSTEVLESERSRLKELEDSHTELASSNAALEEAHAEAVSRGRHQEGTGAEREQQLEALRGEMAGHLDNLALNVQLALESVDALEEERKRAKALEVSHAALASSNAALEEELLQHEGTVATHQVQRESCVLTTCWSQ